MNGQRAEVIVVGAGLAGLCCARELNRQGIACGVLEASDGVGGRVRTDRQDGFLLDRGFQVLLTAYPEARRVLDYDALDLRRFQPGALIRYRGGWERISDPLRRPQDALHTLSAEVGTLVDKLRVARVQERVRRGSLDDLFLRPATTTIEGLRASGFSEAIIERFFRPFLGGIFLERELETTSQMWEFVFRMFGEGYAALPTGGMGAIPEQIASGLPSGTVRLGARVVGVRGDGVELADGTLLAARAVVVATDGVSARALLGRPMLAGVHGVGCLYFAAPEPPITDNVLVLNGDGVGPINNLCVLDQVAPDYAPAGQSLISVSVIDSHSRAVGDTTKAGVRRQLRNWFGGAVDEWRHLRSYHLSFGLPAQPVGLLNPPHRPVRIASGVFVCGDHRDYGAQNGAMVSGRRAAEAVLAELRHR